MVMYEVPVPPDSLQRPPAHYFLTPRVRTSANVEVWFWARSNYCYETTNRFSRSTAMFSASLRRPSSCCIPKDQGLVLSGASGISSSKNPGNEPASVSFNDSNNLSLPKREPASKLLNSSSLESPNVTFSRVIQPSDPEASPFSSLELSLNTSEFCFGQASVR